MTAVTSDPDWPSACWGSSWRNAVPSPCASQASHGQTSLCPGFSTSQTAPGKQCSAHTTQNKIKRFVFVVKMGRWLSVAIWNPDAVLTQQCCVNNAKAWWRTNNYFTVCYVYKCKHTLLSRYWTGCNLRCSIHTAQLCHPETSNLRLSTLVSRGKQSLSRQACNPWHYRSRIYPKSQSPNMLYHLHSFLLVYKSDKIYVGQ